jgi:predicted enzyme related to lactoylglutathione lyase
VLDLDVAREFYGMSLELGEPEYDLPEMGWVEFNSGVPYGNIAVTLAEANWQPNTGTTIMFNVDDCHAACAELRGYDVRCDDPVDVAGYVTFCNLYDPLGNHLQLSSLWRRNLP